MSNSDKNSRKCFSGIVRRLLCSGSLPTHPSDQLIESSIKKLDNHKPEKCSNNLKQCPPPPPVPGIVARLMGLESLPSTPNYRDLGSYFRSKSVNSIDFLPHFHRIKNVNHHHHRRIRTSVSFREDDYVNTVLRLEEELLIKKGKNREIFQEKKPGNVSNRPWKKVENRKTGPGNVAAQMRDFRGKTRLTLKEKRPVITAVKCKEELVRSKCVKSKTNKVLGHKVKKIHPEGSVPEVAREVCSRKQLQSQTANSQTPYSNGANSDIYNGKIITEKNERKVMIKEKSYYKRMAEEICLLTEEDVRKNWNTDHGMVVLKFDDFEDICHQFGQQILEVLLKQFIHELYAI